MSYSWFILLFALFSCSAFSQSNAQDISCEFEGGLMGITLTLPEGVDVDKDKICKEFALALKGEVEQIISSESSVDTQK